MNITNAKARRLTFLLLPLLGGLLAASAPAASPRLFKRDVFLGGKEGPSGKPCYRIPTLALAPDGSLLAFAEGRMTPVDPGSGLPISMNCKRSTDQGRTWSPIMVLAGDPEHSYSDPRVLVDAAKKRVFIFYTQWPVKLGAEQVPLGAGSNSSVLVYRMSADGGLTWGAPVNLNSLKDPKWYVLASIVGIGAQLGRQTAAEGGANGRLIFAATVLDGARGYHNVSVYSDDSGDTWHISPSPTGNVGASESDLVELGDGRLLLSARNDNGSDPSRFHYFSKDGGLSWTLGEPVAIAVTRVDCGLLYLPAKGPSQPGRVLISGPLGDPVGFGHSRFNLGVWKSTDEGRSFPSSTLLVKGHCAYSQIIRLDDSTFGIIYEATPASRIAFVRGALDNL